ncbi:MAG: hypothetical protein D6730_05130 [Bacteroidetes bacterium]|nr:MAG: hypothetical protein D6730_05130 [Bacteroidota bacterium]
MNKIKLYAHILLLLLVHTAAYAQFEVVAFDMQNAYFNNGQELPADSKLIITGETSPDIKMIKVEVYKARSSKEQASLYQAIWRRTPNDASHSYRIPFNYKLRGNTDYDFVFTFYRSVTPEEKQALKAALMEAIDSYLTYSIKAKDTGIRLVKPARVVLNDMNALVTDGLKHYEFAEQARFEGFSDIVLEALKRSDDFSSLHTAAGTEAPNLLQSYIANINSLIDKELSYMFNGEVMVVAEKREVSEYSTERTPRALALNVGYGGVFLDGELENVNYDAAPYVGLSFPLANRAYASRFWSNASISVGVFTKNFTDDSGNELTGPIFGRPYFLGVGYNIFRFVKINAGATAVEKVGSSTVGDGSAGVNVNAIKLKPFVGLSAEIDLWLGLREKR